MGHGLARPVDWAVLHGPARHEKAGGQARSPQWHGPCRPNAIRAVPWRAGSAHWPSIAAGSAPAGAAPLHPPPSRVPPLSPLLSAGLPPFPRRPPRRLLRVSCQATPADPPACGGGNASNASPAPQQPRWRAAVSAALAAAVPAYADLNRFEAEQRGEFGIGSAAQFGSADLK